MGHCILHRKQTRGCASDSYSVVSSQYSKFIIFHNFSLSWNFKNLALLLPLSPPVALQFISYGSTKLYPVKSIELEETRKCQVLTQFELLAGMLIQIDTAYQARHDNIKHMFNSTYLPCSSKKPKSKGFLTVKWSLSHFCPLLIHNTVIKYGWQAELMGCICE